MDVQAITNAIPKEEDVEEIILRGKKYRVQGNYPLAMTTFKQAIDCDRDEGPRPWEHLATTAYTYWYQQTRDQLTWPSLYKTLQGDKYGPSRLPLILRETYHIFIVAMDYPENKKNPDLLLALSRLYLECQRFDGALQVYTLLLSTYPKFGRLNEALFLSGVAAKARGLHEQSGGYFAHVLEYPPFQLKSYQLLMLAAREFEFQFGTRDRSRAALSEAYHRMITRRANCASESQAQDHMRTSRASEPERMLTWYHAPETWLDLAASVDRCTNCPTLVVDLYREAETRCATHQAFPKVEAYHRWALALTRRGAPPTRKSDPILEGLAVSEAEPEQVQARALLETALTLAPYDLTTRYYLGQWVPQWQQHFRYQDDCATALQRRFRGHQGRRRAEARRQEVLAQIRHRACVTIQCWIRMLHAREKLEALRLAQRQREAQARVLMERQDSRLHYRYQTSKVRVLIGFYRIIQAKAEREVLQHDAQHRQELLLLAVTQTQTKLVTRVWKHWWMFWYQQSVLKYQSATIVQTMCRKRVWRKNLARLLEKRARQEAIVRTFLGQQLQHWVRLSFRHLHQYASSQIVLKHQSATTVQRQYRFIRTRRRLNQLFIQRRRVRALVRQMQLSKVQARVDQVFRRWLGFRLEQRALKCTRATVIQTNWRAYIARAHVRKLRSRAVKCERYVQACTRRRQKKTLGWIWSAWIDYIDLVESARNGHATVIQAQARGWLTRQRYPRVRDRYFLYGHVTTLGPITTSLSTSSSRRLLLNPSQSRQSTLLRLVFVALAESKSVQLERSDVASRIIQRKIRLKWAWRRMHESVRKLKILQLAQRHWHARTQAWVRRFFQSLVELRARTQKRRHAAAQVVQRWTRGRLWRERFQHQLERRLRLQHVTRKWQEARVRQLQIATFSLWMEALEEIKREKDRAIVKLQRRWRTQKAQRQGQALMRKKRLQLQLVENAASASTATFFRRWEQRVVVKYRSDVRSSRKSTSAMNPWIMASPVSFRSSRSSNHASPREDLDRLNWDTHFNIPSMLYYQVLTRTKESGVCQIKGSSHDLPQDQLKTLFSCAHSVIVDGQPTTSWSRPRPCDALLELLTSDPAIALQKLLLLNTTMENVVKWQDFISQRLVVGPSHNNNHTLVSLVLVHVPVGNPGAKTLALALNSGMCALTQLTLDFCAIGNAGGVALAESLRHNTRVWKIHLNGNRLSSPLCQSLGDLLLDNTCLRIVSLSDCAFSDRAMICYLAPALSQLTKVSALQVLQLYGNPKVTRVGLEALEESVRGIQEMLMTREPVVAFSTSKSKTHHIASDGSSFEIRLDQGTIEAKLSPQDRCE